MKRRNFIKDMAVGGMMLNLPRGLLAQANPGPLLAQVTGEDPALITKAAVNILGGMSKFVAKGEKVLVKPNIGWDRTPELGACTNPEVVKALVEMCIEASVPGSPKPPKTPVPRSPTPMTTSSRRYR